MKIKVHEICRQTQPKTGTVAETRGYWLITMNECYESSAGRSQTNPPGIPISYHLPHLQKRLQILNWPYYPTQNLQHPNWSLSSSNYLRKRWEVGLGSMGWMSSNVVGSLESSILEIKVFTNIHTQVVQEHEWRECAENNLIISYIHKTLQLYQNQNIS